jgi:hypothetical protein
MPGIPGRCVSVGRVDAARVWARCPSVSALGTAAPSSADVRCRRALAFVEMRAVPFS